MSTLVIFQPRTVTRAPPSLAPQPSFSAPMLALVHWLLKSMARIARTTIALPPMTMLSTPLSAASSSMFLVGSTQPPQRVNRRRNTILLLRWFDKARSGEAKE